MGQLARKASRNQGGAYQYRGKFTYQTNLPTTNWNWNNIICKQCRKMSLKPIPATNELCCKRCGILETLNGAYFNDEELYKCGDYKIVKQRRTSRKYNFRTYIENHRKNITTKGHSLSFETIERLMSSSRELNNIYPNESRCRLWLTRSLDMLCSQQKRSTFCTTSG